MSGAQLPLTLGSRHSASFDNFLATGASLATLEQLRRLRGRTGEPALYLWGAIGCGKTHLLQAVCQHAGGRAQSVVRLPMRNGERLPVQALEGMENVGIVCIDDIDAIAGDPRWERELDALVLRIQRAGGGLVISGAAPVAALGLGHAGLAKRLAQALALPLYALDADGRRSAMLARAERRGMRLPEAVAAHLLREYGGDMGRLMGALDVLERALFATPRKLSVALVRATLKTAGLG